MSRDAYEDVRIRSTIEDKQLIFSVEVLVKISGDYDYDYVPSIVKVVF